MYQDLFKHSHFLHNPDNGKYKNIAAPLQNKHLISFMKVCL